MKRMLFCALVVAVSMTSVTNAQLLNEFEPNPAGGDPSTQMVEISGAANTSFDLWILSIENDGFNGQVDRATNVSGMYNAMGLASVTIGDLENPSNTVILTDSFTGSVGDDLDPMDNGTLDLTSLGTIFDAVGVSDNAGDDGSLYGAILGGTDILFNGEFEPLNVFRDSINGDWYQTVTVNFGAPDQFIGVFEAGAGPLVNPNFFNADPTSTTFGSVNPGFTGVPEPSSALILCLGLAGLARRRR